MMVILCLGLGVILAGCVLAFIYTYLVFTHHAYASSNNIAQQVVQTGGDNYTLPVWYELHWDIRLIIMATGAVLALVAGFVAKPRHVWFILIAAGAISLLSLSGLFRVSYGYLSFSAQLWLINSKQLVHIGLFFLPGLACIIGGIVLHRIQSSTQLKRHQA